MHVLLKNRNNGDNNNGDEEEEDNFNVPVKFQQEDNIPTN